MRVWVMKAERNSRKMERKRGKGTRGDFYCMFPTANPSQGQLSVLKMRKVEVEWNHDKG